MSEETKQLLLRLKKEKKVNKQIEIIQKLKEHNQEEMVNHVLLVHLDRKDHDALRMEILSAINSNDDAMAMMSGYANSDQEKQDKVINEFGRPVTGQRKIKMGKKK